MIKVAGVRFKAAGKVYYFDPDELEINLDDHVIVETARGLEFGTVTLGIHEVNEEDIVPPLKKIIRIADEDDYAQHLENVEKKEKALELCQEKVDKHGLQMKLIDVEYTFDASKVIFYFTADGRVDFRDLVKDLASVFKMRIELRQIGVRDEAKMLGGIGSCGKPLCCHTWLSEFEPVSIKMAKVQNLSLNPTKISGICGRLMCCLKYENDIYLELRKGMPELGERIMTEDGKGKVFDTNILEGTVKVRLYESKDKGKGKGKDKDKLEDDEEKLGTEFFTYKKEDIKRIEKNRIRDSNIFEDLDEDTLAEIKALIKD